MSFVCFVGGCLYWMHFGCIYVTIEFVLILLDYLDLGCWCLIVVVVFFDVISIVCKLDLLANCLVVLRLLCFLIDLW